MAELILTEDEQAADSYLAWDDAALGKLVRHLSQTCADEYGATGAHTTMAAYLLVDLARRSNADTATIDLNGASAQGEAIGDWQITITRK
ncbi:hypothetical protein C84B14_09167 [Salinisphaera sp. C84B14]|uniref:hypothetical protein n=1 Tax=Salinisphaera sp. C84B14 TaxID=1304155 RepID=UPI00333F09FB